MGIHDVTVPIRPDMPVYEGDPEVRLERVASLADGDPANVSRLEAGVHTGTHVDAPVHFLDGADGADALPLDVLVGPARVVDATAAEQDLDAEALDNLPLDGAERVLLKTRNSRLWERDEFTEDFVALAPSGAERLAERGVRLVGIDYLSVGDPETHRILARAGIVPVEGLDLRGVEPGEYRLVCLPLRLEGADGAPCRALLFD